MTRARIDPAADRLRIDRPPPGPPLEAEEVCLLPTRALLHRLWTRAVGQDGYDKREWAELERRVAHLP